MPGAIATVPKLRFMDANGAPLTGGKLYVYAAGTTTPRNSWQDRDLTTLNTNPVILDAVGSCVVWLDDALSYKMVLTDANDVTQWTQDNIVGGDLGDSFELNVAALEAAIAEAATSATNAEASRDAIDNRIYPGTYASDPTTRPDGSAIENGDMYTTTAGVVKVYGSGNWQIVTAASSADLANSADATKGVALVGFSESLAYTTGLGAFLYGTQLKRASVTNLPVVALTPPADFNDQLNLQRIFDGVAARYLQDPYDVIDFTKNPDTTINHYYVDYVNGNDANAGTSAGVGNAWKTIGKANTSAVSPAVIHLMDEWVGYQNRATVGYTWNGNFKFVSGHSSGVTRIQGMRESYTKATFAWVDEGGGVWSTTEASTTATIFGSLGSAMFDAKYLDADGMAMPIPDVGSSAACIATPGSQYHDNTNKKKWVHLLDGREPDPYDGWIYCQAATRWEDLQSSDTGVLLYENLHAYYNLGASGSPGVFRYRHSTTATNNSMVGYKDCMCAGGSGNNFETYDAKVIVRSGCISKYARADCFNHHSFQTTGTDGEYMTVYEYNCKGSHAGYASGWYNQPALGTSCNASTAHDSMHIERMNCQHGGGNGATVADVNGCVSVNWCVDAGPATGTASPKACFWHEKLNWAGSAHGMYLWGCSAHDDDDTDVKLLTNQAQSGGSGNDGQIYVKYWQGQTDGTVTGTVKKFDGTAW